ncbi:MAG: DNA/RNA nuclease SfsA [Pseudomonadota bacterium]
MQFSQPLIPARLMKRYKRFLADAELENGDVITAHCANPGAMLGVKEAGSKIWLSESTNPKRKLKYSWELIEVANGKTPTIVGINTAHPNKLVEEGILTGEITELQGYDTLKREVKYGTNSRIDILLTDPQKKNCYVEVKNVHLVRKKKLAEFPDSVTARGAKHLHELCDMIKEGHRAVMVFLIQRNDVQQIDIASDIDPNYNTAFQMARENGVEMLAYKCKLTPQSINIAAPVTVL